MKYYLFPKVQRGFGSHTASNSVGTGILTQGSEVDHLTPNSAEVKNDLYPKSPICLHGMDTDTLAFLCAATNYYE
jgi:hypothetical protein